MVDVNISFHDNPRSHILKCSGARVESSQQTYRREAVTWRFSLEQFKLVAKQSRIPTFFSASKDSGNRAAWGQTEHDKSIQSQTNALV